MSELRWDPLERRHALIATDRAQRPLDFLPAPRQVIDRDHLPCPFCLILAGHGQQTRIAERRRARLSPDQRERLTEDVVLVLANRYPVLSVETPTVRKAVGPYATMSGVGAHEVVVESKEHGATFATMPAEQRQQVLMMWRDRASDLVRDRRFAHVQVLRNDGPRAGATLEHPHSQLIASPVRPPRVERLVESCRQHWLATERCLTCDILDFESQRPDASSPHGPRQVDDEGGFFAWCPFASARPFEVHISPRRHASSFSTLSDEQALALSRLLGRVLRALGAALRDIDVNLVLDLAPSPDQIGRGPLGLEHLAESWHWRLEIIPRLLPHGGYELGTDVFINPTAPEDAAAHLRLLIDQDRLDKGPTA